MSDETTSADAGPETRPFEAEVARLLHLMVHSVYSNRDLFLRELISNGADACERLRTEALKDPGLVGAASDFKIRLSADPAKRQVVVEDNGIGMDRTEMIENLGTIARSGTRAFMEKLEEGGGSALIGQFGVGFYSAFMVADQVEVVSRRAAADAAWRWRSDGKGSYAIEPVAPDAAPERGTRVVLHLNEDAAEYADADRLERVVDAYSAHVPIPIVLATGDGTAEKTLADGSALWRKPRAEVTAEEYEEFFGHVSGQYEAPALTVHYRAEGRTEYSVLLFVPASKPFDLFDPARKSAVRLYVRRVFITDEARILPAWLRFLRGVVDSEDLPLNLSREMLQTNPILDAIRRGVTNRVLSDLEKLADEDSERFEKLWEAFGGVIKEGLYEEPERRDAIFKIARFRTTAGDGWWSLADYVAAMKENQTRIYYALGDSAAAIRTSPHLEGFVRRGVEVLLLSDPVDAFWVATALGYEGKPFQSVTQGADDLTSIGGSEDGPEDNAPESAVATLAALFKQTLGDKVSGVRSSARLAESPVCLVAADRGLDRQLERVLRAHQQAGGGEAPVLELNPAHPLIKTLAGKAAAGGSTAALEDAAVVLFGQACILEGEPPQDTADYAARIGRLLEKSLA